MPLLINALEMEKVNTFAYIFTMNKIFVGSLILSVCIVGYVGTMACDWLLELITKGKETYHSFWDFFSPHV